MPQRPYFQRSGFEVRGRDMGAKGGEVVVEKNNIIYIPGTPNNHL